MRVGIVVDSTCDLPQDYIESSGIVLLPITIRIGEAMLADHRDPEATLSFINAHVAEKAAEAETIPFSVNQIRDLFLGRLVIDFDQVFCLTVTKNRSAIYDNATQASFAILNDYKPVRQQAGLNSPFALRVIDTQSLFAGQGVSAVEAVRMREQDVPLTAMRERLDELTRYTHAYMIPRDLHYLRSRARAKGDRSVGLMSAMLGSALDIKPVLHAHQGITEPVAKIKGFDPAVQKLLEHVGRRVAAGLMTPTVCLSYGGPLDEMRKLAGYAALRDTCKRHSVEVFESVMSLTGMINVGKGALVVGFADRGPAFSG